MPLRHLNVTPQLGIPELARLQLKEVLLLSDAYSCLGFKCLLSSGDVFMSTFLLYRLPLPLCHRFLGSSFCCASEQVAPEIIGWLLVKREPLGELLWVIKLRKVVAIYHFLTHLI